ncbi:hypothetical protein F5Y02DRAFT_416376 [Annulohypoxylon stygium]|nr:hypothetical protein F5Y02DRAFT_416376 [Annulohypoxylon stygium]
MALTKILFSLLTLATTVISQGSGALDTWTLYNSTITCNTSCEYDFHIQKHKSGDKYNCKFQTKGPPDPHALPIDEPCHADPLLAITLSWGVDLSIIFAIADLDEKTIAYYGLEAYEIRNDTHVPNKTELVWRAGQNPVLSKELLSYPTPWL